MKFPHLKLGRTAACILFVAVFFVIYEVQLFNWQIINGETFEQEAMSNRMDAVEISAARGEIWDRDGNVLAGNHTVYEVIYNALYMDDSKRNSTILEVIDLLEERGEAWRDILPIRLDEDGAYHFIDEEEDGIAKLKTALNMADYATAEECMAELSDRYHYEGHSREDTRTVVSVRYSMTQDGFSIYDPYVIATGVSPETVGVFGEYAGRWPGIETRVNVDRYYGEDGTLAPHIVGQTAKITAEDLAEAKENGTVYDAEENVAGYKADEEIGATGAEAAFESDLRGQRGLRAIFTDENGDVTTTAITQQPEQGHTVQLTLDSKLQEIANWSLERNIKANKNTGAKDDKRAHDCRSGAAVVLDVSDFGVLASSSYPSYDLNLYNTDQDYRTQAIQDEENLPLLDRALQGIYTPGSVFKPMVAIAGLQEGSISSSSTYECDGPGVTGVFELAEMKLPCTGKHYMANVYDAISGSCNCYFAQLGLDLDIRKLDAYAEYFGLGELTGVELAERKGFMSSPQEYRDNHTDLGVEWTDGLTAQAAIGQCDNMFTPIQLATYAATLANGGQRYRTHFLQQVWDYTGEELVRRYQPELLYDAEIDAGVQGVVREAMCLTATEGTARSVFANYPISVACKTGTAETSGLTWEDGGTEENISFICYAPAEAPEIAVAVMLEHGHTGSYAVNVAKDIMDYYFGFVIYAEDGKRYNQDGDLLDDDGNVVKTKAELDEEAAKNSPSPSPIAGPDGSDPIAGPEASGTPSPTVPPRGSDIPDTIYTGGPTSPKQDDGSPTPEPSPEPIRDTPYYSGKPAGVQATSEPDGDESDETDPDPDGGGDT